MTAIIKEVKMLDITAPEHVEVEIQNRPNGNVLYIHVDGITVLRICRVKSEITFINTE